MNQIPVLDRAAALDRLGFEDELLDELLQSLIARTEPMLLEIGAALEQGDLRRVEALAHSIKGAAATLEATGLAASAAALEAAARTVDPQPLAEAVRHLSSALAALVAEL
jgi:HPt (histidine-containing phosphotransfer) domain-containing protein